MKRRYAIVLILLGIFLMIGGVTYAYFTGKNLVQGEGASLSATTVTIEDVGLSVEGTLTFNDENIWPGHQDISAIRVTAYGENLVTYNLIWEGTSTISTAPLKYYVYKANTEEKPKVTCTKKKSGSVNFRKYYEECTKEGFENLGEIVQKGEINNSKVILKSNEAIKGTEQGTSVYYYVIVEFPNEGDNQNEDFGHNFEGKVTVEETKDDLADITIAKISKINNGVEEEIDKQPDKNEGYTLDLTKSNCDKDATLNWNDNSYSLKVNVKQTGTKCDLVFKPKPTAKDTLADLYKDSLTVSENTSKCPVVDQTTGQASSAINFPSVESGTLLCKGYDDDGETYYFRGMAEKNWVKIDNTYWRIIRINGNGSLRLIFSGNGSVQTTGIGTMALTDKTFNIGSNDNAYVGYMYGKTAQIKGTDDETAYYNTHANEVRSSIFTEIMDNWYNKGGISENAKKWLDGNAGFCGDRAPYASTSSESSIDKKAHGYGTTTTYYGARLRIESDKKPSFKCPQIDKDLYTTEDSSRGNKKLPIPVGLITADEVMFAGSGYGALNYTNKSYYLYTIIDYWTMSPYEFSGSTAWVFYVDGTGHLGNHYVYDTHGVRPVINLKADTPFESNGADGSSGNPFTVSLQ